MTSEQNPDHLLAFWYMAQHLKQVRRRGWTDRGVAEPESSADHSWGVALLGWILAHDRPDLDRERVLLLGLVHDLPEAIAGDATPFDRYRAADGSLEPDLFRLMPEYSLDARVAKAEAESAALDALLADLGADLATQIRAAWTEYEEHVSAEACFVHQIDKLETLLQAQAYAGKHPEMIIDSFRAGAERDVTDDDLRRLMNSARTLRQDWQS